LKELRPTDIEFLYRLCEATMKPYVVAVWGQWSEPNVREGLAKSLHDGEFSAVVLDAQRVGAISVLRHHSHHQLEQLYILPEYQRQGLGALLVQKVVSEAQALGVPVRLRVLTSNPARALYERLGFKVTEVTAERYFMEYSAS
jgi:ribosomal protein S18 acetylase RimI-like enzyme